MESRNTRSIRRWTWAGTLAAIGAACVAYGALAPGKTHAALETESKVVLYSQGRAVQQWTAVGEGKMDQGTYVFAIKDGVGRRHIRISGTFSVEELRH